MGFAADMEKFALEIETEHVKNVEKVEDYVYNLIRVKSPIDTGAYRSSHNRTSNKPDYSWDKNKTNSTEPQPTGGKLPVFYVATGCPYAGALEAGHSGLAALGVYGVTYAAAKAKFQL